MNASRIQCQPTSNADLSQVIAPLASYICATDRPRETLFSALTALFDEVQETNTAALLHVASRRFAPIRWAWPRETRRLEPMLRLTPAYRWDCG